MQPPADAAAERAGGGPRRDRLPRAAAATFVGGFLMGSADIVPGVSGGTVALVLGIYERLIANIRLGAAALANLVRIDPRGAWGTARRVEWSFLLPLLVGIATAFLVLARGLRHLLETQPVRLSSFFAGLVVGSVVIATREIEERRASVWTVIAAAAVLTFLLLGLRTGRFVDPSLLVVFAGGALAICAMILPGISGSFILLMVGLYQTMLEAVDERAVVTLAVFAVGAALGLAVFSTLLHWLLRRYHDLVLAVLIGLMAGSLRVLWPWPAEPDGVGTTALGAPVAGEVVAGIALAVAGVVLVVLVARWARSAPAA